MHIFVGQLLRTSKLKFDVGAGVKLRKMVEKWVKMAKTGVKTGSGAKKGRETRVGNKGAGPGTGEPAG